MQIRKATQYDIKDIVEVLKASLGEEKLSLSEEIWNYKHFSNPFGESIVLLAEENTKIIGVRAFMKWQWQSKNKIFSSLRAVDTATHPDFQGRGIFKNLTLKAVEVAKDSGNHLVFNTPNDQSRPGYLRMGWKTVGKVNVGIKPTLSFLFSSKFDQPYALQIKASDDEIDKLCERWNAKLSSGNKIFTPKNRRYLKWRYENNPLQSYEVFANDRLYLAGYVKQRNRLKEFRISECIFDERQTNKELKSIIKNIRKRFGGHLVSFSPQLLSLGGKEGYFGPILTLNNLNLSSADEVSFFNINNWYNSLGDLELF